MPEVLLFYRTWGGNMSKQAWEAQERSATEIVAGALAGVVETDLRVPVASTLRGLATNRYPASAIEIRRAGDAIVRLHRTFANRPLFDQRDRTGINRDAAVRLWLLASLALRRSPLLAASLARRAGSIQPSAVFSFTKKVLKRLSPGQSASR